MIPPLAALCAKMTTHEVEQHFTAEEALSFYAEHLSWLPEEQLRSPVALNPSFEPLRHPDNYRLRLSADDRELWKACRVPRKSWGRRLLNRITETEVGWKVVSFVRRTLKI